MPKDGRTPQNNLTALTWQRMLMIERKEIFLSFEKDLGRLIQMRCKFSIHWDGRVEIYLCCYFVPQESQRQAKLTWPDVQTITTGWNNLRISDGWVVQMQMAWRIQGPGGL